jgi:hypothetical protein
LVNRTGPINLNIAPTPPGSAGAGKLTETANNTLKGEPDKDPLTGVRCRYFDVAVCRILCIRQRPDTDLTLGKKRDLLTEGGAALDAPSVFSPAADSAVPTLVKDLSPVFTDANGALAGTQPLGINSAPFGVAKLARSPILTLLAFMRLRPLGI